MFYVILFFSVFSHHSVAYVCSQEMSFFMKSRENEMLTTSTAQCSQPLQFDKMQADKPNWLLLFFPEQAFL